MQDKLQELTDKLFKEGLSKGKEEGEALLADAKRQAGEIVAAARSQAEEIVSEALKQADDAKKKAESDIRMAAEESLQTVRSSIADTLVANMSSLKVDEALSSDEFVKGLIKAVAANFSSEDSRDLEMVLPESLKEGLEPFVKNELAGMLGKGVDVSFSRKIGGGMQVGPKDGGYYISLTNDTFKDLIASYLRPVTKRILFGEQ
jgi:V/A-type H+-transporting ATPase subunit E